MSFTRFALYFIPPIGALSDFGAAWLGWNVTTGEPADQPDIAGLHDVTMTPRKYGFHGTLKPPFRLAPGCNQAGLERAVADLAARLAPAVCDGLALSTLGRFLALTPVGDTSGIARVASACVTELDSFRAPAGDAELARRRAAGLTDQQEQHLTRWGYPYVLDAFRFHLTLSSKIDAEALPHWRSMVADHLPPLPAPFQLGEIALVGEREDGMFQLIHRYPLTG